MHTIWQYLKKKRNQNCKIHNVDKKNSHYLKRDMLYRRKVVCEYGGFFFNEINFFWISKPMNKKVFREGVSKSLQIFCCIGEKEGADIAWRVYIDQTIFFGRWACVVHWGGFEETLI